MRPTYRTAALRESRQAIAATIAEALTDSSAVTSTVVEIEGRVSAPMVVDDTQWGEFLVAGL